ncbi:UNVERIFIED_CONTAM: hypothetical protein RMT77_019682 [Armadillidium vulgare]
MERGLRPDKLEILLTSPEASRVFKHWLYVFTRFKETIEASENAYLGILANSLSCENFEIIVDCTTFDEALNTLKDAFIKPANEVVARHHLSTGNQTSSENIDEYLRALYKLRVDCNFRSVSAEEYKNEYIRDTFITSLNSQQIRTRLLENNSLDLTNAVNQARSLEIAFRDSHSYQESSDISSSAQVIEPEEPKVDNDYPVTTTGDVCAATDSNIIKNQCYFCGGDRHSRSACPARNSTCRKCRKLGHYARVCRRKTGNAVSAFSVLACVPDVLKKSFIDVTLNGENVNALIDTGSSENFVSEAIVHLLKISTSYSGVVSLASSSYQSVIDKVCYCDIKVRGRLYFRIKLLIMKQLCTDVVLGLPFLTKHSNINLRYDGPEPSLDICALTALSITPPRVFSSLSSDCRPKATKSRKFGVKDSDFIRSEINRLLSEDIIENSQSPWRAQVLIVNQRNKRPLVIDYSQTINKFTYLDAYPLPSIDDLVNKIANYKFFSTIDLKSAYHLVPLLKEERHYTAFEANGRL